MSLPLTPPGWPAAVLQPIRRLHHRLQGRLRRRLLLQALGAGGLLGWLATRDALAAPARPSRAARAAAGPARANSAARPPATLVAFIDHLIPADELTPAASALQVPQRLWAEVQADADYLRLVQAGCAWLDRYAPGGFVELTEDEREQLVAWMAQAPWEAPQRRFFALLRVRAMQLYYADPAAREGMPMQRPPQPVGYTLAQWRPEADHA